MGDRVDMVSYSGDGNGVGAFGFATNATKMNHAIDASSGKAELEERAKALHQRIG